MWTLWEGVVKQDVTLNHPRLAVFCHYFLGIIDTGLNMVADGVGVDTKHGGRLADSHPIWGPTTTVSLLTPFSHIRAFHIPTTYTPFDWSSVPLRDHPRAPESKKKAGEEGS